MRKPVNKQEIVPTMMMRKAAGLLSAESGAPFRIMPTKMAMNPRIMPMMVDVSKKKTPYVVLNEVCDSIPCLLDYNIPHKKRKSYLRPTKKENPTSDTRKNFFRG